MARDVIEAARRTCVRREERERIALAGRTGRSGSRGTLARHVRSHLEGAAGVGELVAGLTGGARLIRLRDAAAAAQGALDLGSVYATGVPGEEALSAVLGAGFECAPVTSPSDPQALPRAIEAFLHRLGIDLLGRAPDRGDEAWAAYDENTKEIRRIAVHWLQSQVRRRLN